MNSEIMQSGFENATLAFSKFVQKNIHFSEPKQIHNVVDTTYLNQWNFTDDFYLVTTEIKGEISGKSYLFCSKSSVDILFDAIQLTGMDESFTEPFLLELDNILSATVITQISNKLSLQIYGAVPEIKNLVHTKLDIFIEKELVNQFMDAKFVFTTEFSLKTYPECILPFVWIL